MNDMVYKILTQLRVDEEKRYHNEDKMPGLAQARQNLTKLCGLTRSALEQDAGAAFLQYEAEKNHELDLAADAAYLTGVQSGIRFLLELLTP